MATTRVSDRVGQVLGGRFRLRAPIGTGASATVYLADDEVLGRSVAVKVLHPALADDEAFLRRFRDEARAAAALNHPHILAVHDWGEDGDTPYLVSEYLAGGSLRAMVAGGRLLTPSQALMVGLECARGLEYAHRRGFVHRDIKPANLLFDDEGRLRIADFGLARALAEASWSEPVGAVLGTARYASPEQARGEPLDGRSDVYSLALVLIESVTGRVPFAADTTLGTLMARLDRPLPIPEELAAMAPALTAAGAPDPRDRSDAAEFGLALMDAASAYERPRPLPLAGTGVPDIDLTAPAPGPPPASAPRVTPVPEGPDERTDRLALPPDADEDITLLAPVTTRVPPVESAPALPLTEGSRSHRADRRAAKERARRESAELATARALVPADAWATSAPAAPPQVGLPTDPYGVAVTPVGTAPGRRRWPWVLVVALVIGAAAAGGTYWWTAKRVAKAPVPELVGLDAAQLEAKTAGFGWRVTRTERFDETAPAGQVLEQRPPAGVVVEEGQTVEVVVSLGPPPVAVPTDVAGGSLSAVTERLATLGIGVGDLTRQYDENAPVDQVLGVAPGTPAEVIKGTPIGLVVSDGPAPRTIPEALENASQTDVTNVLRAQGLVVSATEAYSETVPKGQVIAVKPGSGSVVPKGSTVVVTVSKGPQPVEVPDVKGLSVDDATAELEDAGLSVKGIDGSPRRKVESTDPAAGTEVKKGTEVTLKTAAAGPD